MQAEPGGRAGGGEASTGQGRPRLSATTSSWERALEQSVPRRARKQPNLPTLLASKTVDMCSCYFKPPGF